MPEETWWSETVKVVDVSTETSGGLLQLVMDGEGGEAAAYIEHVQES